LSRQKIFFVGSRRPQPLGALR